MSKQSSRLDARKVNSELLTMTYGALVTQLLRDWENPDEVNKQLERIGYNIGVRLIEDYLARTYSCRCLDMRETADKVQHAFKIYANMSPTISNWSSAGDEFSLMWDHCPLSDFAEMPPNVAVKYCSLMPGAIRGALQMVQLDVHSYFVQDQLKGDAVTELRVKLIKRLEDAVPAGED